MRSVPLAMTWEMLWRGFWTLIGLSLAANALPVFLLTALRSDGAIEPDETVWVIIHLMLIQISVFLFGTGVSSAQGHPSRLFVMPISNSSIATWHLLPAMAMVAAHSAGSTAALNAVFGLESPIWGPTMFMAVAFAGFQATCWFTEKSGWIFWGLVIYGTVFGLWFKSRYGAVFSQPTHLWKEVTSIEVMTMMVFFVVSHFVAVKGIARNRCGEPLPSFGIIAWIERIFDPAPDMGMPFQTPLESHFWLEWRRKGLVMPAGLVLCMVLGLTGWLISSRDVSALLEGFLGSGGMLSFLGLIVGFVMGHFGANNANCDMGSFFATRQMTSTDFARSILKTAAKSVLITWGMWAVATFAVYLLLLATSSQHPHLPTNLRWWYWPATLLGAWIVVSAGMSIGLTGRAELFVKILVGLAILFVLAPVIVRVAISPKAQGLFIQWAQTTSGLVVAVGTVWAFVVAHRRSLIRKSTVWLAASIWIGLFAAFVAEMMHRSQLQLDAVVFITGLLTLTISPLATAPLAIAWNRNR